MIARQRLTDRDLTPAIIKAASQLLKELYPLDLGAEREIEIEGSKYVAVLERHNHTPESGLKPVGPHKGVSMFRVLDTPRGEELPAAPRPGPFVLGIRSRSRLQGLHPDLIRVVERAIQITPIDFTVVEGLRTKERQAQLFAQGASKTMRSRHLTGHAVDLAPFEGGIIHWDWPRFRLLAPAVTAAAAEVGVPIQWGGSWPDFPDGPHWQLPVKEYP